ncbi:MAG: alpha/beta fold hydrolase [Mycobacterium sp.]|uniref:alpha/beta hydrolase n=1 Tax=Mycobacterium sp. TaxID=1785 RepID=UPI003C362D2B
MLEVIDKGSLSESHPAPLLFVHGGQHAAWCWDEHFLDFFAAKGYRAVAVSLRGHGTSPNSKPPRACSITDYVEDVQTVADNLPQTPVVIGHSLGGFVVQKYLESHAAPAAALVASAPPQGAVAALLRNAGALLRNMTQHPWRTVKAALTGQSLSGFNELEQVRAMFFSAHTPESLVVRFAERLQNEPSGRWVLDMMFLNLPNPRRVSTPLLVLGAQCDRSVTTQELHATARAYRTQAEIFPKMGHDMMLEPGWVAVAQRIHSWLCAQGL